MASTSSCPQLLIYMGLGSQPFSLQAILNSCTLGFQDVMKCSGPCGELGRWQYNYTGWSLMSYTVITSLPPEAKAGWTCSRGFIKWGEGERRCSFSLCICLFFELNFLTSVPSCKWLLMSLFQFVFALFCSVSSFLSDLQPHKCPSLHDMRKYSSMWRTMKYYASYWLRLDSSYYSGH